MVFRAARPARHWFVPVSVVSNTCACLIQAPLVPRVPAFRQHRNRRCYHPWRPGYRRGAAIGISNLVNNCYDEADDEVGRERTLHTKLEDSAVLPREDETEDATAY